MGLDQTLYGSSRIGQEQIGEIESAMDEIDSQIEDLDSMLNEIESKDVD